MSLEFTNVDVLDIDKAWAVLRGHQRIGTILLGKSGQFHVRDRQFASVGQGSTLNAAKEVCESIERKYAA
jgi:hypothetical protein